MDHPKDTPFSEHADPDSTDGALPSAALAEFVSEFQERTKHLAKCELCSANDWELDTKIGTPTILTYRPGKKLQVDSGKAFPSLLLTCKGCGNVKLLRVDSYVSLMPYLKSSRD